MTDNAAKAAAVVRVWRAGAFGAVKRNEHLRKLGFKWCPTCETPKPLDAFDANAGRSDGLCSECADCHRARQRVEGMTAEQVERRRARQRVEGMTAEQVERRRARKRVGHMTPAQAERERARKRDYNATPEGKAANFRANSKRRAAEHGVKHVPYSNAELLALTAAYEDKCYYCNGATGYSWDHRVALVDGGPDAISNLVPACLPCNTAKHAKDPVEFLADRAPDPALRAIMAQIAELATVERAA